MDSKVEKISATIKISLASVKKGVYPPYARTPPLLYSYGFSNCFLNWPLGVSFTAVLISNSAFDKELTFQLCYFYSC